jgi:hypothetical protein
MTIKSMAQSRNKKNLFRIKGKLILISTGFILCMYCMFVIFDYRLLDSLVRFFGFRFDPSPSELGDKRRAHLEELHRLVTRHLHLMIRIYNIKIYLIKYNMVAFQGPVKVKSLIQKGYQDI